MSRTALLTALVCLVSLNAGAQTKPADPNDAPTTQVKKPETPGTKYLQANPGATALTHAQGQLRYRNADRTRTTILGALTHRDPQSGAWVPNAPVLSSTKNGWDRFA